MSCDTSIKPFQLTFSNVTLTTNGQANTNGVALQVGTPKQILSLTPSVLLNNTVLNNRETCGDNANTSCIEFIGGGYDSRSSSSFQSATSGSWNGSVEADLDSLINIPSTYFNDVLTVASGVELPGFPMLLQPTGISVYSLLGLGSNSTFINRLVEAGLSPSRSWSFFPGVYSSIQAGALIIGGYADRFYEGTLYTKNITNYCDTCFKVNKMEFQRGDTVVNLLPDNVETFTAVVDPYYPVMIVPDAMRYKFGNATNGTWSQELGLFSYPPGDTPQGHITVTLGNGLVTTIPNKALFDPPAYDNGLLSQYRNGSTIYGAFTSTSYYTTTPSNDTAIFGMPYAAFVYLVLDQERRTVSIASANQNAEIGGDATPICSLNSSGGGGGSNHAGAIAGGVVGGLAGLVLIAVLAWFLWRRKKRGAAVQPDAKASDDSVVEKKAEMPADNVVDEKKPAVEKPTSPVEHFQEMSSDGARSEMAGEQPSRPVEMPAHGKVVHAELPA